MKFIIWACAFIVYVAFVGFIGGMFFQVVTDALGLNLSFIKCWTMAIGTTGYLFIVIDFQKHFAETLRKLNIE